MRFLGNYLLLLFVILSFAIKAQENKWQLEKNEDGIKVYIRESDVSSFDEFKGICTFHASPKQILVIILHPSDFTSWMPDVCKSKMLKKISAKEQIDYIENSAPWPVKNRDAVVERKVTYQKDSSVTVNMQAKPDYIPEKDGIVRIQKMHGFWKLIPVSNDSTKVIFQVLSDPGGELPSWLVNSRIVDTPFGTLQGLQKMLKD